MKYKIFLIVLILSILNSCVSKSDYEDIKSENKILKEELQRVKEELSNIRIEYELLIKEKREAEAERNKKPFITEAKALKYIKDNYDFYEKEMRYRNIKLRRVDDNEFRVSVEECNRRFSDDDFFWNSRVRNQLFLI